MPPLPWTPLKRGIQYTQLLPPHREQRRPPDNLTAADEPLFAHEFERQWGPCEIWRLDHLSVLGASWVQWRWGRVVDQLRPWHGPRRRNRGRLKDLAQLWRPPQRFTEALWVHDDWSGNYFHWLTDVLPKLQAWFEAQEPCRTVVLPEALLQRRYVAESLERMGFRAIGFRYFRLEIDRLTVLSPTAPTGNFRSALLRRLRQALLGKPVPGENRPAQGYYISRADAAQRFLRNELELIPILEANRVERVQLEGRSLAEQIELFSTSRLLVGLHGAGLTNMLWMPPGSVVIEIRRCGDNHNNCYFAMACALGHTYRYVQAEDLLPGQTTYTAELQLVPSLLHQELQAAREALSC